VLISGLCFLIRRVTFHYALSRISGFFSSTICIPALSNSRTLKPHLRLVDFQRNCMKPCLNPIGVLMRPQMCEIRVMRFTGLRGCGCDYSAEFLRCQPALAHPTQKVCVPQSGNTRDLPRSLDVVDDGLPGKCSVCRNRTPPSSSGSQ